MGYQFKYSGNFILKHSNRIKTPQKLLFLNLFIINLKFLKYLKVIFKAQLMVIKVAQI